MADSNVLLAFVAGAGLYYLYKKKAPIAHSREKKLHNRRMLLGLSAAAGQQGAGRYILYGKHPEVIPYGQGRAYGVQRAIARRQYVSKLRPADFYDKS